MMGIPFRCAIGLVAEKLLNREQVNAILGERDGKSVSEVNETTGDKKGDR
jgi:hypothetical protein